MQRPIWFARRRHFPDNLSAESTRVACPAAQQPSLLPATHFLSRRHWSKLSTGLREAGVAGRLIAASRPKLHVQQHSPSKRRCQVSVWVAICKSLANAPQAHARCFAWVEYSLAFCGSWSLDVITRHRCRTTVWNPIIEVPCPQTTWQVVLMASEFRHHGSLGARIHQFSDHQPFNAQIDNRAQGRSWRVRKCFRALQAGHHLYWLIELPVIA